MQFKSLMVVAGLGLGGLAAHAQSAAGDPTARATFSNMRDTSFVSAQAQFFLPSVLATDEGQARSALVSTKAVAAAEVASDDDAEMGAEALAMLMAGLGVVGFVASRRRDG